METPTEGAHCLDPEAQLQNLIARYKRTLRRSVSQFGSMIAEDAFQAGLVTFWEEVVQKGWPVEPEDIGPGGIVRPGTHSDQVLYSWLIRAVRSRAQDANRRVETHQKHAAEIAHEVETTRAPEPSDHRIMRLEELRLIRWVLHRLSPKQAQIIRMMYKGRTKRQIAARLHESVNSVGPHMVRADEAFRVLYLQRLERLTGEDAAARPIQNIEEHHVKATRKPSARVPQAPVGHHDPLA